LFRAADKNAKGVKLSPDNGRLVDENWAPTAEFKKTRTYKETQDECIRANHGIDPQVIQGTERRKADKEEEGAWRTAQVCAGKDEAGQGRRSRIGGVYGILFGIMCNVV